MTTRQPSDRSKRRLAWAAPLGLAVLAAGACADTATTAGMAGPAQNTAPAPNAGTVRIPDAETFCSMLSGADISQVTGQTYGPAQPTGGPDRRVCSSGFTGDGAGNPVGFSLRWGSECTSGQPATADCVNGQERGFTLDKQGASAVQDITGIGDQAFCSDGPAGTELEVLKGWIRFAVDADTCAHEQVLAGILLPKLTASALG